MATRAPFVVNEGSTAWLAVSLYDKAGALAAPDSLTYRIDCPTTGGVVLDDTDINAPGSTFEIRIPATLNAILAPGNAQEYRRVTLVAYYDGSTDVLTVEFDYVVRNLSYVPLASPAPAPAPAPPPPPPPPSSTQPRFFIAPDDAWTNGTQGYMDAAVVLTGSHNGGVVGSFSLTTSPGNFGWVAFDATASANGVAFFDGIGYGGWSGAGQSGNYSTGDTVDTSTVTFTDTNAHDWRLFRQDYVNSNPLPGTYSTS